MRIDSVRARASGRTAKSMLFVGTLLALPAVAGAQDPSIFAAGAENRAGLTFTPDGKRAFWAEWDGKWGSKGSRRVIYTAELRNGIWTRPVPAPFSQHYSDDDPFVSRIRKPSRLASNGEMNLTWSLGRSQSQTPTVAESMAISSQSCFSRRSSSGSEAISTRAGAQGLPTSWIRS